MHVDIAENLAKRLGQAGREGLVNLERFKSLLNKSGQVQKDVEVGLLNLGT